MAAVLTMPAFAVDGLTLINQLTVTAEGGFPSTISCDGCNGVAVIHSTGSRTRVQNDTVTGFRGTVNAATLMASISSRSRRGSIT